MAFDSALVQESEPDEITLRIYGWKPVTLSIGALDSLSAISPDWLERVPLVRRPTSGGILLHDAQEISFSLGGRIGRNTPDPAALECACQQAVGKLASSNEPACATASLSDGVLNVVQKREHDRWLLQGFVTPHGQREPCDLPPHPAGPAPLPTPEVIEGRQLEMRNLVAALGDELEIQWVEETPRPAEVLAANRLLARQFVTRDWHERR